MIGHLERCGHTCTTDGSEADVIVVNTCSFVEEAKRESIETILDAARLKTIANCKRLVVAGCMAERYPHEIRSELEEVDAIVGTNQLEQITSAVSGEAVPPPDSFARSDADHYLYDHNTPRTLITPRYSAYMKISEGCDHTCSFCIIPKLRGPFRSRTVESLVKEAANLADQGVKEITLVSQDSTSFGTDRGARDGLAYLLDALAAVDGIQWIRFLYAYPNMIGNRLLEVIAEHDKICNYLDIPLQHAGTGILRSMRRGGSRAGLSRLIRRIRRLVPDVTIRTSLMVGYPGETEDDFRVLKDFVKEMEFERLGAFVYSDEESTAAYHLQNKVPKRIARRRWRELMDLQLGIRKRKSRSLIGREFPVLIEGISDESELLLQGRLQSQAPEIDGVCLINDSAVGPLEPGEFRTIRITRAVEHDLLGTITG
jgi:ribosomal protein S12 methylthiotransferase